MQEQITVEEPQDLKALKKINWLKSIKNLILYSVTTFLLVSISGVIWFAIFPPTFTPLMILRGFENAGSKNKYKPVYHWMPLEKISSSLVLAVIASEDNNFLNHYGLDIKAIEKAKKENIRRKRPRGASTISQQTAKNLFLLPIRSYVRKGMEVYFTLLIETIWSKRRIVEVYLNIIEMGKGVYGAEAAAQIYYKKPAKTLTGSQSAMLAAILPNPQRRDPRNPSGYMYSRQSWILWNMNNIGKIEF